MTGPAKPPLIKNLNRHKDEFWWIHPAMRAKQSLSLSGLSSMPADSHLWARYGEEPVKDHTQSEQCIPVGQGNYADLAKVLYKLNGYRPGPVRGWYVVVCVKVEKAWAVAQLRADTQHPLQVFSNLVFGSEEEARNRALQMRNADPGASRLSTNAKVGRSRNQSISETIANEREFQERLSGQSGLLRNGGYAKEKELSDSTNEPLVISQKSSAPNNIQTLNQPAELSASANFLPRGKHHAP